VDQADMEQDLFIREEFIKLFSPFEWRPKNLGREPLHGGNLDRFVREFLCESIDLLAAEFVVHYSQFSE